MSFINFDHKIFRLFGFQINARDFYTFSERWLFSTNHKYIGTLYLLFSIGVYILWACLDSGIEIHGCQDVSMCLGIFTLFRKRLFYLTYAILWISIGLALIFEFSTYQMMYFICISIIFSYEFTYESLNLKKTFLSFICFSTMFLLILGYLLSFIFIYEGYLAEPILLDNLSVLSQYRYLALFISGFVFIIIFIMKFYFKPIAVYYTKATFPYMKEEVKEILYQWHDIFWEPIFISLLEVLKNRLWVRICYLVIHFLLFVCIRLLILLFFIKFIFFNGDLRWLLFLSPISFMVFLLSFVDYYYAWYFKESIRYLNELLKVEVLSPALKKSQGILFVNKSQFKFQLTPFAVEQGFSSEKTYILCDLWFEYGRVDATFSVYLTYVRRVNLFILAIQVLCWLYLVHYFFITPSLWLSVNYGSLPTLTRRCLIPLHPCRQPFQVHGVKKAFQNKLAQEAEGSYSPGHCVVVDPAARNPDNPSEILYGGANDYRY